MSQKLVCNENVYNNLACFVYASRYMDKKLSLKLNGGRNVQGILRGFDPFMNVVVDEALEICKDGKKNEIGMVVRMRCFSRATGCSLNNFSLFNFRSFEEIR